MTLFSNLWKSGGGEDANLRVLQLPSGCKSFKEMFDTLQSYLKKLCGHDDFVTGILSKQKGQALRVAAVMNALFSLDDKYKLKALIDEDAVKAAIDFVQVCGDHASLLSGRRRLAEVVAAMDTSKVLNQMHVACLELLTGIHCVNNIITQLFLGICMHSVPSAVSVEYTCLQLWL